MVHRAVSLYLLYPLAGPTRGHASGFTHSHTSGSPRGYSASSSSRLRASLQEREAAPEPSPLQGSLRFLHSPLPSLRSLPLISCFCASFSRYRPLTVEYFLRELFFFGCFWSQLVRRWCREFSELQRRVLR